VVGDLIGSGESQERGIVGETPNLAARLQGIAEPNMVVIAVVQQLAAETMHVLCLP
jgi:class 3 adenylate cyclase